jgi:Holliday junction resolvase-like predicted endonuclease
MMDMMSHPVFKKEIVASIEYNVPVISEYLDLDWLLESLPPKDSADSSDSETIINHKEDLHSMIFDPVKASFDEDAKTVGFVVGIVPWHTFFHNVFRRRDGSSRDDGDGVNGIIVKVVSDCGSIMTYEINSGRKDRAKGGDCKTLYQDKYSHLNYTSRFFWKDHPKGESRHCHFDLIIYPSDAFYAAYASNSPTVYACIVAGIFLFTAFLFGCYDCLVSRKQQKIVAKATQMVVDNAKQAARNERGKLVEEKN